MISAANNSKRKLPRPLCPSQKTYPIIGWDLHDGWSIQKIHCQPESLSIDFGKCALATGSSKRPKTLALRVTRPLINNYWIISPLILWNPDGM